MPRDLTDDKSTLVQVMAWCRQATSHYLNQCWPRSPMPYGVTRPQWVKLALIMAWWPRSMVYGAKKQWVEMSSSYITANDVSNIKLLIHWRLNIGSGKGLAQNRQQAITGTNVYPIHWPRLTNTCMDHLGTLFINKEVSSILRFEIAFRDSSLSKLANRFTKNELTYTPKSVARQGYWLSKSKLTLQVT